MAASWLCRIIQVRPERPDGLRNVRILSAIWFLQMPGAIFRARAAHIVLLGPVRIAQRTPDCSQIWDAYCRLIMMRIITSVCR